MKSAFRAVVLGLALAALPSCASVPLFSTPFDNPIAAARTLDQRAYAALDTYAVLLEEATKVVADPNVPITAKRALGQAERAATPAMQVVESALAAYLGARTDFEVASSQSPSTLQRATDALNVAVQRLNQAVAAASPAIAQLQALVRSAH